MAGELRPEVRREMHRLLDRALDSAPHVSVALRYALAGLAEGATDEERRQASTLIRAGEVVLGGVRHLLEAADVLSPPRPRRHSRR